MSELSDIVAAAIPIFAGAHVATTLGRAYVRYQLTQDAYPTKSLLERLPRCTSRRVIRPETFAYSAVLGTVGMMLYTILRNI